MTLLAGAAVALVVLVGASAGTRARATSGGTLVVGLATGEPDALDPTTIKLISSVEVLRTVCERLYDVDSKAQVVPQLAAALPVISKDKLTYTIALRKGVVFNDGTPFNAQAVVTTIERDLTLSGSVRASDFSPIDSVTVVDPYTVAIHLNTPFTWLTDYLASAAGMIMSPAQLAKLGANFATDPVCVGPFTYDNRVAGDSITVVKSPYYYGKRRVHLDRIVFKVENDTAAAVAALEAGDLQALDLVSPTELQGVKQALSLRVLAQNQLGYQAISFNIGNRNGVGNVPYSNLGTPLASSPTLRKAFEEALDRKTLAKVVLSGKALPGCTPVTPASRWFDATVQCTPYDPGDAKKLLRAASVSNLTVHLLTSNLTDNLRLAEVIQAEEAAVGINVVIDPTDAATASTRAAAGHFDAYVGPAWTGSLDPDGNIYKFLETSGSRNWSGYSNLRLDLILNNARTAITTKALKTLYHAAEQIIVDERPMIVLYHAVKYAGLSANVTGVQFYPDVQLRVAFAQFK